MAVLPPAMAREVPAPLEPWVSWVLPHPERLDCPRAENAPETAFLCAWPDRLELSRSGKGLAFRQRWHLEAESWLALPGEPGLWPERVRVDGREALVVDREGVPSLRLEAGKHQITGWIGWEGQAPDSIQLPAATGLVSLEGRERVPLDPSGRLKLAAESETAQSPADKQARDLDVRVVRRLDDRIPMRLETRVQVDVSGPSRELVLGRALPEGFVLLSLDSPLPARIEADGRLRLQVRAGQWELVFQARALPGESVLGPEPQVDDWPEAEFWAFQAQPHLRQVRVEGGDQVEPAQAPVPAGWKHLPVFRLSAGQRLELEVLQRGLEQDRPARLRLQRDLWLDFSARGAVFRDRLQGRMGGQQRLDLAGPMEPGRISLDGQPALITHAPGAEAAGVEVRQQRLHLEAVGRLSQPLDNLRTLVPAGAWLTSLEQASLALHLPPGWRLMAAGNADSVEGDWLGQWRIWDIFLVLLLGVASFRTLGPGWALVAVGVGTLAYHEAPGLVALLLVFVLIRPLVCRMTGPRLRVLGKTLNLLVLVAVAAYGLLFAAIQVRYAVYPQLEQARSLAAAGSGAGEQASVAPAPATASMLARGAQKLRMEADQLAAAPEEAMRQQPLPRWSPDARIQTGPGVPQWRWRTARLQWQGPVQPTAMASLWLLKPPMVAGFRLLSVALLGALVARCLLGGRRPPPDQPEDESQDPQAGPGAGTASLAVILLAALALPGGGARADGFPDPAMLDDLRERLLAPPLCAPHCVSERQTLVALDGYNLTVTQSFSVLAPGLVTLPAHREAWQPASVLVNGAPASRLRTGEGGYLQLPLPAGNHEVVLEGAVREQDSLSLRFPEPPHRFNLRVSGWQVSGLSEGRPAGNSLQFQRLDVEKRRTEQRQTLFQEPVEPFVRVERTLTLDNRWAVETRVTRLAPRKGPVELPVPLLPGESPARELERQGDAIRVVIPAGESSMAWRGFIKPVAGLTLLASEDPRIKEVWRLDVGPQWHLDSRLLPPVRRWDEGGLWLPEWEPRPAESLVLAISRPEPVEGRVQTIESVRAHHRNLAGHYRLELSMQVRQFLARRLQWPVPEPLSIRSLRVNGQAHPLPEDRSRLDLALPAGEHRLTLELDGPEASGLMQSSPALTFPWPVSNLTQRVDVPAERWLLFARGTGVGPALLYWSVVPLLLILALALGRHGANPLGFWQWLLLGLGLSLANPWSGILMVAWFYAMADRQANPHTDADWFNLRQLGLVILTLSAFTALLASIPLGMLGEPSLWIEGNGSSDRHLFWYLDRLAAGESASVSLVSAPLWVYRLAMLAWALWLAVAVIDWLRWGWAALTQDGGWRRTPRAARSQINEHPKNPEQDPQANPWN